MARKAEAALMVSERAGNQPGAVEDQAGAPWFLFSPQAPLSSPLLPRQEPACWLGTKHPTPVPANAARPPESQARCMPMWAGGAGSPRRGTAPAPTDDLFARKLRQPARPPLTPHTFEPRPARGPLLRSGSDAGEARPPTPASPRARAHSHEEASRPAAVPTRLFTDPLALLGLPAEEPEPTFPPVPEPRWFAHYDVQSLLFDWAPRPGGTGGQAEATSGTLPSAEDRTASSDLLLEAPGFVSELGGEGELGLGGPVSPPVPPALPNAAVSILEEPQNRTSAYSLEHADLGAGYYRKYFYNKGEERATLGGQGSCHLQSHSRAHELSFSCPYEGLGSASGPRLPCWAQLYLLKTNPSLPPQPGTPLCLRLVHFHTPPGWGQISFYVSVRPETPALGALFSSVSRRQGPRHPREYGHRGPGHGRI